MSCPILRQIQLRQINHEGDEPELASDEEDYLGQGHLDNDDRIELGNAVITAALSIILMYWAAYEIF